MADKVGDEFEGYVTGVAAFGLFVELIEHFVEGLVHVSTMADDYYRFIETAHVLRGENTQKVYRLGDKVKVQVIRVNMEVRQIDLGLVEILDRVREGERGPRRSKARPKHERRAREGPARQARARHAQTRQALSDAAGCGVGAENRPSTTTFTTKSRRTRNSSDESKSFVLFVPSW